MISSFKKKKRDGFTLVELLVVIAILAVLASVSVIGYLGFTKKAKVSNDVSLTTQMNRILQAEEAGGETFDTPHDAITALKEGGLDVTKLTPTTDGYSYVYDSSKHQMFLLDGSKVKIAPENIDITSDKSALYAFIGNESEISSWSDYSLYLKDGFVSDGTIDVTTGVDTGDNIINLINYSSTESNKVVIRTSSASTNLTVNAPSGTIYHYGSTGCATLTDISDHSFWEYGKTAFVELTKGRIVLTEKSDVEIINVTANGNTYNNPIIADGGVKNENMPLMISRDAVSVSGSSTDLAQIQKLDSNGEVASTEQVKAYLNGTTGSTVKNDTQNTDVNSILGGIVLDTEDGKNALNETQKTEKSEEVINEAIEVERLEDFKEKNYWIGCASDSFAGGDGSENNPYQIATAEQLSRLSAVMYYSNQYKEYKDKYYEITADIDLSSKCWVPIATSARGKAEERVFTGNLDGKNHTIKGLNSTGLSMSYIGTMANKTTPLDGKEFVYGLFGNINGATISNLNFENVNIKLATNSTEESNMTYYADSVGVLCGYAVGNINISNVKTLSGIVEGYDGVSGLIGKFHDTNLNTNMHVSECSNAATINAVRRAAGIIGNIRGVQPTSESENGIHVTKCTNSGAITSHFIVDISDVNKDTPYYSCAGIAVVNSNWSSNNSYVYNDSIAFSKCTNSGTLTNDKAVEYGHAVDTGSYLISGIYTIAGGSI